MEEKRPLCAMRFTGRLAVLLFSASFFTWTPAFADSVNTNVFVVPGPVPGLRQADYRWYANADAATPTAPLAAENTATTTPISGKTLRLRVNAQANSIALNPGATFELQFYHVTSSVTSTDAWIRITSSTAWAFGNNPSVADGQTLTSAVLGSSTVAETYNESHPTAGTPANIPIGGKGEWDWVIRNNFANPADNWFFRMRYASGTPLEGYVYQTFPRLLARTPQQQASTTFATSTGGVYGFNLSGGSGCTFSIPNNYFHAPLDLQMNSYASSSFTSDRPPPSGNGFVGNVFDFGFYTATSALVTTLNASATVICSYQDADVSDYEESTIRPYRMGVDSSDWSLLSSSSVDTALNKVTFSTRSFSSFALIGESSPSSGGSSSGGGSVSVSSGGGGGGTGSPKTGAIFRGKAYPGSKVTLLKDGQVFVVANAGADGGFEIAPPAIPGGLYVFGVWAEDAKGLRSVIQTFSVYVPVGATTIVADIFLSPTISIDKVEVKRGEQLLISGQSTPNSLVEVEIGENVSLNRRVTVGADGMWSYALNTLGLATGNYAVRARTLENGRATPFSKSEEFSIGTKTILSVEKAQCRMRGDADGDCRVDVVDFSVLLFWYKQANPPTQADLNRDGKVDLVDFSILAFYWTG